MPASQLDRLHVSALTPTAPVALAFAAAADALTTIAAAADSERDAAASADSDCQSASDSAGHAIVAAIVRRQTAATARSQSQTLSKKSRPLQHGTIFLRKIEAWAERLAFRS